MILTVIINIVLSYFNLSFTLQKKVLFEKYGGKVLGVRNISNRSNVINIFKRISERVDRLVKHCKNMDFPNKEKANRLYERWNKVRVRETDFNESSIAYIINKDYELRICVTDKIKGEVEDLNTAMFVMIHELSHMMCETYGHGAEFWDTFRVLLGEAIKIRVYDYQDYSKSNEDYCGILIYSTPCKDSGCTK